MEENKWNEFEKVYKNNLLILNLFLIFLHFFFPYTFVPYFVSPCIFPLIFREPNITLKKNKINFFGK